MTEQAVLLQAGIVLQHDSDDQIKILRDADILIENGVIKLIGKDLIHQTAQVVDCREKIVCPGFIDTHHHVWQTQLKGRHSDDALLDYHPKGNLQYFNYTAEDVFWGELGGLMESVDGGTTTIVDHAHCSLTEDRTVAGFSATLTSGIRSIYCPSLVPQIKSWNQDGYELSEDPVPAWFLPLMQRLCNSDEVLKGRLHIGLGFDGWYLSKDDVINIFEKVRGYGTKLITSHWRRNTIAGSEGQSVPAILQAYGLLGQDIILSHATGSTEKEFKMMKEAGVSVSATPATESQMAHGEVVGFRDDVNGSLGSDCHSNNHASILHAMQIGLAVARSHRNSRILSQHKVPKYIEPTTVQAFNLATIDGARAIHMEDQIGSIKEGNHADLIIFSTQSPSMTCAVDYDPLVAVVRHATNHDIEAVMVGGRFLKQNGKLNEVTLEAAQEWDGCVQIQKVAKANRLSWTEVADQLRRSQKDIQRCIDGCNIEAARTKVMELWGFKGGEEAFA